MKLFFIASTCYTLYLMKYQYRLVYVPASPFLIAANLVCPPKVRQMIQPLIPSKSNISSARALYSPSSSTTSSPSPRFCGRFLFSSNLSLFYLNSSCFNGQGRQRQLQRTIWPRLVSTEPSIFPIGSTGTQISRSRVLQF